MIREKNETRKVETHRLEGVFLRVVGIRDKRKSREVLACPHRIWTPRVKGNVGVRKHLVFDIPSGPLFIDACACRFDPGCITSRRSRVSIFNTSFFGQRRLTSCRFLFSPR
jgi:hypothetical protein